MKNIKLFTIIFILLTGLLIPQTDERNPGNIHADTVETILSTPQTITASWADVGDVIDIRGYYGFRLWATITYTGTTDVQIRVLVRYASGATADEHEDTILTVQPDKVLGEPEYLELNVDDFLKPCIYYRTDRTVYYIQVQIKAGTPGTGTLDKLVITKG